MDNSNNTVKLIGALLLGAAIGGALGILFAPNKGSETRKKITGKSDELTDAIKENIEDFLEEIKKEVVAIKDKATDYLGNGITKVEKTRVS